MLSCSDIILSSSTQPDAALLHTLSESTLLLAAGLSFSIKEPQILALVGPNGSGKTTLMNCMMNLLEYQAGTVKILGKDNKDTSIFREISYLKDNNILYPYLTGYDHLKYISDIQKLEHGRIDEVAAKIGITSYMHKNVSSYSLGMKQHLLIAMSIMNKPKLILMDEPLTGLDPDSIIRTRELIQELYIQGVTILLSSHSLSEIDFITTDILFLSEGKVMYEDIEAYKKMEYSLSFHNEQRQQDFVSALENSLWQDHYRGDLDTIKVNVSESEINDFIGFMASNKLEIANLTSRRRGAEERYREIFHL